MATKDDFSVRVTAIPSKMIASFFDKQVFYFYHLFSLEILIIEILIVHKLDTFESHRSL